jgi:galactose mutarotase-like enzyme
MVLRATEIQTNNSITLTLIADEETLAVYPFNFRFSITYTLDQNKVTVTYDIENCGKENMYFSVGAHPAFAVPLAAGTVFTDHYLQFDVKETAGRWPLSSEGLIDTTPIPLLNDSDSLSLTKELFFGDALVFKNLRSNNISILTNKNPHGVELQYEDFPYMGIWSAKNADFVCIEPWCGIADSVNVTGDLTKKEGIHTLLPGKLFTRSWSVKVF